MFKMKEERYQQENMNLEYLGIRKSKFILFDKKIKVVNRKYKNIERCFPN